MVLNKFFRSKFNSGDTKKEYEINIATNYVTSKTTYINTVASSVLKSRATSYTTSWYTNVARVTGVQTTVLKSSKTVYKIDSISLNGYTRGANEYATTPVFTLNTGQQTELAPGRQPQVVYARDTVGLKYPVYSSGVHGYIRFNWTNSIGITNEGGSNIKIASTAMTPIYTIDVTTSTYTSWTTLVGNSLVSRTTSYTTSWYSTVYRTTEHVTSITTLKNTVKKIIIEDENSMNILMLGNFYLGNNIGPTLTYLANENVKELTIDGTLVRASTPGSSKTLPAGTVTKSNISGMLGDGLLEDTSYNSINIFNISTNGFYTNANNNDNISSWHKSHPVSTYSNSNDRFVYSKRNLFERIEFAKNKLKINDAFTHIVVALHDNNVLETNIETIKLKYMQLFIDLKSIGIDGTIVLLRKGNANYIEAQNQLIAENDFIVEGPDLSTVLESNIATPITIANSIKDSIITSMNFV